MTLQEENQNNECDCMNTVKNGISRTSERPENTHRIIFSYTAKLAMFFDGVKVDMLEFFYFFFKSCNDILVEPSCQAMFIILKTGFHRAFLWLVQPKLLELVKLRSLFSCTFTS